MKTSTCARVLIVEDSASLALGYAAQLEDVGHEVTLSETLADARHALSRDEFDVVLLDLQLPDGDGLTVFDAWAGRPGAPCVIVVTGDGSLNRAIAAMRLGAYECRLTEGSIANRLYDEETIFERHRHRYEVNIAYRDQLADAGMLISGLSPDGSLPEIVERADHPFFVAVQFHPELKSKPFEPHPLFTGFVAASMEKSRLV